MTKPKVQLLAMLARAICILILVGLSLDEARLWAAAPLKTIPVGHAAGPIAVDPAANVVHVDAVTTRYQRPAWEPPSTWSISPVTWPACAR
jgi:hypothetical protein